MKRLFFHAAAILLALSLVGCGATVSGSTDDATITTRVKTMFLSDPSIRAERIDVKTFKGVVTLSGRVSTEDEGKKAVALARKVRGVTDVKSTFRIQP